MEEGLPLRSGHEIPVRDGGRNTAGLVGDVLDCTGKPSHHEKDTDGAQHTRGPLYSAARKHGGQSQPRTQREGRERRQAGLQVGTTAGACQLQV